MCLVSRPASLARASPLVSVTFNAIIVLFVDCFVLRLNRVDRHFEKVMEQCCVFSLSVCLSLTLERDFSDASLTRVACSDHLTWCTREVYVL